MSRSSWISAHIFSGFSPCFRAISIISFGNSGSKSKLCEIFTWPGIFYWMKFVDSPPADNHIWWREEKKNESNSKLNNNKIVIFSNWPVARFKWRVKVISSSIVCTLVHCTLYIMIFFFVCLCFESSFFVQKYCRLHEIEEQRGKQTKKTNKKCVHGSCEVFHMYVHMYVCMYIYIVRCLYATVRHDSVSW